MSSRQGPECKQQTGVTGRMALQAAHVIRPCVGQPTQDGGEAGGLQGLLGGPQALGLRLSIDPDQLVGGNAFAVQPRQVGHLRGADQDDGAPLASQLSQGREQQPPFALARLRLQDFCQALHGPAPARQVRV